MRGKDRFAILVEHRAAMYAHTEDHAAYDPETYVGLERRFLASVEEFMETVPESLSEDQRRTIRAYVGSKWYTWEHYLSFVALVTR